MKKTFNEIMQNELCKKPGRFNAVKGKEFSNEIINSYDIGGFLLYDLTFSNCNFIETNFFKSELTHCRFQNCKIVKSNLSQMEATEINFIECEFEEVLLAGADFMTCKFVKPKFYGLETLDFLDLQNAEICDSKKCIQVKFNDNIADILNKLED